MKNGWTEHDAIGQSGVRAVTVQVWDSAELRLRDCLIDAADLGVVSAVTGTWCANKVRGMAEKWYAITKVWTQAAGARTLLMHRVILGLTDPKVEGDHGDNDGLNNQRYNLRVCSHRENMRFRDPGKDWEEFDRRRLLAEEYRKEREIAGVVAERFGLSRQQMWNIRRGGSEGKGALGLYREMCGGVCRSFEELKLSAPVESRRWGAVRVRRV